MQNDQCLFSPWECQSTLVVFLERYWMSLLMLIFFSLLASLLLLTLINAGTLIGQKKKSKKKSIFRAKPLASQIAIGITSFLFFMLSPLVIVQTYYGQYDIQLTDQFLHCAILDAANECYIEAAKSAVSGNSATTISYRNAHNICNITLFPEKCKISVCESISAKGATTTDAAKALQQGCINTISPTCPDGNILDAIPCSCYLPEEERVAVYTTSWYEEYWNLYRKMDRPPYCCDGIRSSFVCGE